MKIGPAHLTYCTNIHPAERWREVERVVQTHVLAVKERVCPNQPFGVGLRLSGAAAKELEPPEMLARFAAFLQGHHLYVFTINGFPHGTFHGTAVKEQVYRPDWLEPGRVSYSDRLARILTALWPAAQKAGVAEGSVSTVPGAFRARAQDAKSAPTIAAALVDHAATLHRLKAEGGPTITLALEPEPECLLETTADAVAFFQNHLLSPDARTLFAARAEVDASVAEEVLLRHVGVCLDACHAAVEFEDPTSAVDTLEAAGIKIAKLQLSTGLSIPHPTRDARAALARFAEGVYLHQVVVKRGDRLERILDLPEALARVPLEDPGDEWRVHFHVPIHRKDLGAFENTGDHLAALLARHARKPISAHLEVETYTWDVLPEEHRRLSVVDGIADELRFVLSSLTKELT